MAAAPKRNNALQFLLLFLMLYIGMQLVMGVFFPNKNQNVAAVAGPALTAKSSFTIGADPVVTIKNVPASEQSFGMQGWFASKLCSVQSLFVTVTEDCAAKAVVYSGNSYALPSRCPQPPLDIFAVEHPGTPQEKLTPLSSSETAVPCQSVPEVKPGASATVSLAPWKYSLFEREGTFEVRLPGIAAPAKGDSGSGGLLPTTARFSIGEPGVFTKAFRTFISAPFLNFLIFVASVTPGHNLGVAIIILTLVVKLLLFFPTQHALEGQKKMQMLQPKIEALKAKYNNDQAKIQEETMKLWKEHKINPFQSCLPLVVQFPVLIGLFYIIRDGTNLELSRHLIYGVYQNLPWHFGTHFLGLDLLTPNLIVMPVLLVVLQFFQMKLSFSIQKRKKKSQEIVDVPAHGKEKEKTPASPQDLQQKMMLYGLPLMIGFFALRFPSAVAVYWGVSTLFAIGQQIIVNREHLRV